MTEQTPTTPTREPFDLETWQRELGEELRSTRDGDSLDERLKHAAGIAVGAASVCWESMTGTGVFQDDRARAIMEELVETFHTLLMLERGADRERRDAARERERAFASMVADLDRNVNGRHEGDDDYGDPSGVSQGNPLLPTGTVLGYSLGGSYEYRMPEPGRRHDPQAWKVRVQ